MSALTFPVVTFSGNRFKENSDLTPSQYVSVNVYSACHLTKSNHGNNMFTSCCKLALGNNSFAEVYTMKKIEHRIDLREWKNDKYASKKGISLNVELFKTFVLSLDMIDEVLNKKEELYFHMGSYIACVIQKDNQCVDIRQYWRPPNEEKLVPAKKGLCRRQQEYKALKSHIVEIEKAVPGLESLVPCYMRDDHLNQSGMLQCSTCNLLEFEK